nr:MAG TPA: oxidoreductase [Caudoviricetes sp.]
MLYISLLYSLMFNEKPHGSHEWWGRVYYSNIT